MDEELEAQVEQRAVRCSELPVQRRGCRERVGEEGDETLAELLVGVRTADARRARSQLPPTFRAPVRLVHHEVLPQLAFGSANKRARERRELVRRTLAARRLQRTQLLQPQVEHQVRQLRIGLLLK